MPMEEIKSLPFASDQAAIRFAWLYTALVVGHVTDRGILFRRNHIKAFRWGAWCVPLAVFGYYTSVPALPSKFKDFFWSFGIRGRFWPPYHDDEDE